MTDLSTHAQRRCQQRSIPASAIALLEEYGSAVRCGGASRYFFKRRCLGPLHSFGLSSEERRIAERYANCFAIIGDNGRVVTAGHRTKRFKR